jgi:hypothetical protein
MEFNIGYGRELNIGLVKEFNIEPYLAIKRIATALMLSLQAGIFCGYLLLQITGMDLSKFHNNCRHGKISTSNMCIVGAFR